MSLLSNFSTYASEVSTGLHFLNESGLTSWAVTRAFHRRLMLWRCCFLEILNLCLNLGFVSEIWWHNGTCSGTGSPGSGEGLLGLGSLLLSTAHTPPPRTLGTRPLLLPYNWCGVPSRWVSRSGARAQDVSGQGIDVAAPITECHSSVSVGRISATPIWVPKASPPCIEMAALLGGGLWVGLVGLWEGRCLACHPSPWLVCG